MSAGINIQYIYKVKSPMESYYLPMSVNGYPGESSQMMKIANVLIMLICNSLVLHGD